MRILGFKVITTNAWKDSSFSPRRTRLNLDLNNFGGGNPGKKLFSMYSSYFLLLSCTGKVIAGWRRHYYPFLVSFRPNWHSLVGGGRFGREIEDAVLGSPCIPNNAHIVPSGLVRHPKSQTKSRVGCQDQRHCVCLLKRLVCFLFPRDVTPWWSRTSGVLAHSYLLDLHREAECPWSDSQEILMHLGW